MSIVFSLCLYITKPLFVQILILYVCVCGSDVQTTQIMLAESHHKSCISEQNISTEIILKSFIFK